MRRGIMAKHQKESRQGRLMKCRWNGFMENDVLFDFSSHPPGYEISSKDLKQQLKEMDYTLKPYDT